MKIATLLIMIYVSIFANVSDISDTKQIKNTLLKYNYGIIKMGKSGETQFFKEFVKEDVAVKLQVWFESWKFSNLTYIANINDFIFGNINYNENNATITTLENWTFTYVNLGTKKVALEQPVNMLYKVQYTLEKHPHGWIIVDVKNLQEKKIEEENTHTPSLDKKVQKPSTDTTVSNPSQGKIATH